MEILQPTANQSNISWPDVYFTAETNGEPFEDVEIVSLKSYYVDKIYEIAICDVGLENEAKLQKRVTELVNSGQFKVREHVKVRSTGIVVVVNKLVIDDDAIWPALELLSDALGRLEGKCGRVEYGEQVAFLSTEISWLHKH